MCKIRGGIGEKRLKHPQCLLWTPLANLLAMLLHPKVNASHFSGRKKRLGPYIITLGLASLSPQSAEIPFLYLFQAHSLKTSGFCVFTSGHLLLAFEKGDSKSHFTASPRLKKDQDFGSSNLTRFLFIITTKTRSSQGTSLPQPKFLLSQQQLCPCDEDPLGSLGEGRMAAPDVADR